MHCGICSVVEGKEKLLNLKLDGLQKHSSCSSKNYMGEYYQIFESRHQKNERIFYSRFIISYSIILNGGRAGYI